MPDSSLTNLTAGATPVGADLFYSSQASASRKVTGTQIVTFITGLANTWSASQTLSEGSNFVFGTTTGTKLGTATTQKIGFFNSTPVVQQASGANLTNSVTAGGVDDTIADFSDLTVYANSAAAIRNDIYQLARKLKQVNDALRLFGLLT